MNKLTNLSILGIIGILVVLLSSSVSALSAQEYSVSYFIEYERSLADISADFGEPVSGKMVYELPLDARGILLYIDGEETDVTLVGNRVVVQLDENKKFRLEYISKSAVAGNELVTTVQFPFNATDIQIKTSLPSGARLTEPAGPNSRSVFPNPNNLYTDGQNIDIIWEFEDMEKGDDVPILVKFLIPGSRWIYWLVGLLIIVVAGLGILVFVIKNGARKSNVEIKEVVRKEESYENHLKEDEEQIVRILKMKEGKTEQGTLRVITGFSKAKLSGLLKEMEERKIIHKEKRGKKNLVFLKNP